MLIFAKLKKNQQKKDFKSHKTNIENELTDEAVIDGCKNNCFSISNNFKNDTACIFQKKHEKIKHKMFQIWSLRKC